LKFSVVIVVSDADPFHVSIGSASTGFGSLPEGARCADPGPSHPSPETREFDPLSDPKRSLMRFRNTGRRGVLDHMQGLRAD
jgi:hypothetical protein